MVRFNSLLALSAAASVVSAFPTSKRADGVLLTPELDSFIQGILSEWGSSGGLSVAAVSLGTNGTWTIESKGYGVATNDGTAVDDDTMFPIGSNSKLFTALTTGLLLVNESITPPFTLDTKIKDIFPEWQLMDDIASSQSTIVDLLSHRTGLPRHDFSYRVDDDIPTVMGRTKYLQPTTSFRNAFQYNNIMYAIASYLPTVLLPDSIPFARYVKQHIIDPLGLTSTTFSPSVAAQSHVLAQGFTRRGVTEDLFAVGEPVALDFWAGNVTEDGNALAGAGGVIMNGKDLATWLQALLLNGANPSTGEQVIPAEVAALAASGVTVLSGTGTPAVYGAGQWLTTYRGSSVLEHDGSVPGFVSTISRLPDVGVGLAIMSNDYLYGGEITAIVKNRILDTILGLETSDISDLVKESVRATYAANLAAATPRPSEPAPSSVDPAVLGGAYFNGGYGTIDLCYVASSDSCSDILAHLPNATEGADTRPTLIAQWDKVWASHIRLQHFDGDLWNVSALASKAFVTSNGVPTGEYWTQDVTGGAPYSAQFVVEGGNVLGFGTAFDVELFFNRTS